MTASTVSALQLVPADDLDAVDGGVAPWGAAAGAALLVCGGLLIACAVVAVSR